MSSPAAAEPPAATESPASADAARSLRIHPSWAAVLEEEFTAPYMADLRSFLEEERSAGRAWCPPAGSIFAAFDLTPFEDVRVVIVGQDPYHGPGQAHGLSFSVPAGVDIPPSLRNVFRELADDLGVPPPAHGNLEHWSRQGVLMLNATLTVRQHEAGSHQGRGWERFTDAAIRALNDWRDGLIFLLWGRFAGEKGASIDRRRHTVLVAPHPSPLSASRGFFGCRHFSRVNDILGQAGGQPIDWALPPA